MFIFFKVRRALNKFEFMLRAKGFKCKVRNATTPLFFRASDIYAYIKVDTDEQKREIKLIKNLNEEFRLCLIEVGIDSEIVKSLSITVESQRNVDRSWDGNWFYALFK